MVVNFENIKLRPDGTPERPVLRLQTLAGKTLGVLTNAYNIDIEINYSSLSKIEFDVARWSDGVEFPLYDKLTGFKVIYTDALGIYVLQRPEITGDGISEVKHLTGYSLEQLREGKLLYLEEGTYNFWNPVDKTDTILARILELFPGWSVGDVDPRFVGMYRTFESYNQDVLQFCYNDASDKYLCVFVFDVYKKVINVYSAEESRGTLPIYLGYENLVKETRVTELSDEIVTKLHVYGDDGLTITACNPLGTDYIVNLSHYVENGDLDIVASDSTANLGEKYLKWKAEIAANQEYFLALSAQRANALAQQMAMEADLADLNEDYETLRVEQGEIVQAIALQGSSQAELDTKNAQMKTKQKEIDAKQAEINTIKGTMDSLLETMKGISTSLSIAKYFTKREQAILEEFLQEQELSEETFVATDIGTDTSGTSGYFSGDVQIASGASTCEIYRVDVTERTDKKIYSISGGTFTSTNTANNTDITAEIVRGTFELTGTSGVLSLYLCDISYGEDSYPSGMITLNGKVSGMTDSTRSTTEDGVPVIKGASISFTISPVTYAAYNKNTTYKFNSVCMYGGKYYRCIENGVTGTWNAKKWLKTEMYNFFMSTSVTEYQRYSVTRELYEFGEEALEDMATPTYEFSLESSNFLFLNEFASFKNSLDMGKAVYVRLSKDGEDDEIRLGNRIIEANLIGLSFSYEDRANLSLTFSNRFKRRNGMATLEGMIKNSYSSTRNFDTSKYSYGKVVDYSGQVEQAMKANLDLATKKILGAHDQSVEITESGIHVSGFEDGNQYQLRIIDSMIAMSDDGWQTSKLAIGRFNDTEAHWDSKLEPGKTGPLWGVNADVIFGKQLIGQSMIIESRGENTDGTAKIKQFKFDANGAWMNNATFTVQNDKSRISIDPTYGIVGGTHDIFSASGTEVTYKFLDSNGNIKRDKYGIPSTSNSQSGGYYAHEEKVKFFLDLQNGNAYFNGNIVSRKGYIGGWELDDGMLYSGSGTSYVRLNPGVNEYGDYAIWCGADEPSNAPFWVKKNGDMKAKNGMFTGQLISTGRGQLAEDALDGDITTLPDIDGDDVNNDYSALYIFDTTPNGDTYKDYKEDTYKELVGFIAYDEKGAGITEEKKDRVIFRTTSSVRYTTPDEHGQTTQYIGVPIKIQSGSDISIECKQIDDAVWRKVGDGGTKPTRNIYMMSPTVFSDDVHVRGETKFDGTVSLSSVSFGAHEPPSDGVDGQIFICLGYTDKGVTVSPCIYVFHRGWIKVANLTSTSTIV